MFLIRIFYFTSAVLRQYVLLELPWTLSIISTKVPTGRPDGLFVLAALRVCVWPRRSDARNCIVVMALPMWIFFLYGPMIPIPYPRLVHKITGESTLILRPLGQKWASCLAMRDHVKSTGLMLNVQWWNHDPNKAYFLL